jgi:hypothetical protein
LDGARAGKDECVDTHYVSLHQQRRPGSLCVETLNKFKRKLQQR